jgi:serine/threonine protein kinase
VVVPQTPTEFGELMIRGELFARSSFESYLANLAASGEYPADAHAFADLAIRDGIITSFQASLLLQGRWKNFYLAGKYKVMEHLGAGGMGTVFLCEHRVMRRRVAVKLIPPHKQDAEALRRFQIEAQAAARLDHPNIVRAHDIENECGVPFLVMEYINGISLQALVETRGPLPVPRAINYIGQAACGLRHAASRGLVHRDIKPNNLMLEQSGTVKILDFGLARFARPVDPKAGSSDPQTILGTADYLSPEQARQSQVDCRADLYSLGAVAYYLLTGKPPFDGGTIAEKLARHQMENPADLSKERSDVSPELAAVLAKMLSKSRSGRPQSADELLRSLAPWLTAVAPPTPEELPGTRYFTHRDNETTARLSTSNMNLTSGSFARSTRPEGDSHSSP